VDKNLRAGLGVAKRQINCVRFASGLELKKQKGLLAVIAI
jgi:hypothetical protein